MPRLSLFFICYVVACVAVLFSLILSANGAEPGVARWLLNSLGLMYGGLLYVSGTAAIYVSIRVASRSKSLADLASALPFAFVPTLIGLIGLLHGFISFSSLLRGQPTPPKPSELYFAQSVALASPLVGLCFSTIAFVILATVMLRRSSVFNQDKPGN
ncbi:MAG: hypothetical protein AAFU85_25390 [Planctomycetota bacterium]